MGLRVMRACEVACLIFWLGGRGRRLFLEELLDVVEGRTELVSDGTDEASGLKAARLLSFLMLKYFSAPSESLFARTLPLARNQVALRQSALAFSCFKSATRCACSWS